MARRGRSMKQRAALPAGLSYEGLEALLERHGLGMLRSAQRLAGGTSNTMLRLNDELVLRLNTRDPDHPRLRWEALIFRRLQREAGMAGPEVLALDTSRDLVPYDALFLSWADGVAADTVWPALAEDERKSLTEELGRRIGAIHSLRWPAYGERGLGVEGALSSRWTDVMFHKTRRAYGRAVALNVFAPRTLDSIVTTLNDGEAVFDAASSPALVHSDLCLANIVLRQAEGTWIVAAVVDWEEALLADAAWEFADLGSRRHGDPPYPLPGAFLYGYRERHPVAGDLQVRRRLYRLLHFFELAVRWAEQLGPAAEQTLHNVRTIDRLLLAR